MTFLEVAAYLFNALWPAFAIFCGLTIGMGLLHIFVTEIRRSIDVPDAPEDYKTWKMQREIEDSIREKRKNDDLTGFYPSDEEEESEKPKAIEWRLGDDGEMVPVVEKHKNGDVR